MCSKMIVFRKGRCNAMQCRCASLDGDADRLVYFQSGPGGGFQLLDGDRISVLAALLVRDILKRLPSDVSIPLVGRLALPSTPMFAPWVSHA